MSANHTKLLPRLKRIEGQAPGLQQMIENERDCVEIAHQIIVVIAALRRVHGDMAPRTSFGLRRSGGRRLVSGRESQTAG